MPGLTFLVHFLSEESLGSWPNSGFLADSLTSRLSRQLYMWSLVPYAQGD